MTDDELLKLETAAIQSIDGELRGPALKAAARIRELLAQLPSGMEHCTIEFKECEHGHGRLVATNWVDHGCHFCRIRKLEAERTNLALKHHEQAATVGKLRDLLDECEKLFAEFAKAGGAGYAFRSREILDKLRAAQPGAKPKQGE